MGLLITNTTSNQYVRVWAGYGLYRTIPPLGAYDWEDEKRHGSVVDHIQYGMAV